jgi:hypothetical protein
MSRSNVAETLGIHLRKEIIAEIEARGAVIDKKKGTYAALILEKWFADGCPAVNEIDGMMQTLRKAKEAGRIKKPPAKLNIWKLDPETGYTLVEDPIVQDLMNQLGIGNMFDGFKNKDKFETFVIFDNHPTHWLEFTLIKGYGNKRDDGLVFDAWPKASTPRYEIEKKFRDHCARVGIEHRGPVKLSQIPTNTPERIS